MSKSRSPSPTHNLPPPTNITHYSLSSTTSRPQPLSLEEDQSRRPVTLEYRQPLTVRLSPPPPEPQVAESSTSHRRRRSAEASRDEPMAKRIRRESPETRGNAESHSSPSSDSQDDMADNETDSGKGQTAAPLPPAPPKKKRTRTLTTPHQSAVLHALLAQSRFPTTAMREEVGRAIGLSARKVQVCLTLAPVDVMRSELTAICQIWFQNQRQKARRPRSQSDAPANRLPQYGAFPSAVEPMHPPRGFEQHGAEHMAYAGQPRLELHGGMVEPPARLLGPGMPGAPGQPSPSYRPGLPSLGAPPPLESRFQPGYSFQRAPSPQPYRSPRMYPLPGARPSTSQPSNWRERDPSRTLPPLESTRPMTSTYSAHRPFPPGPPYPPPPPAFHPPRSISPEPRFAHHPPEPSPRAPITLPPPFTLQPSPQWDDSSYTPLPRPTSSPWSRPTSRSTRGRSTSPVAFRREHMGETSEAYYLTELPPLLHSSPRSIPTASTSNPPPSRSGRYDPVRATFVAQSPPPVSRTISPTRAGGREESDEPSDKNGSPVHKDL
ncbi:hypothetical protein CVT26_002811 [Gymnopilus dilepis]|uniref:Homeobox domain-containing protein n=1 Tax=Gymnopilus dilepis TaxID=231916 RepID=A0A409Y3A9_9AGAR|nr:hypothetical protein CVT26_002811 [Gymnopilus dilepis]